MKEAEQLEMLDGHSFIDINSLPGCSKVTFIKVTSPVILGKDLESKAMRHKSFETQEDLIAYLIANDGKLYIMDCMRVDASEYPDYRDTTSTAKHRVVYKLRCAEVEQTTADIGLVVGVSPARVSLTSLIPYREVTLRIRHDQISDLATAWGDDEAARQLGRLVMNSLK